MEPSFWLSDAEMYAALGYIALGLAVLFGLTYLWKMLVESEERRQQQQAREEYLQLIEEAQQQVDELRDLFNTPSNRRK